MKKLNDYFMSVTGSELTKKQIEQFKKYYELLVETNKVMNLTAITDKDEVVLKHFIDSLAIQNYVDFTSKKFNVIDIGTGAGFPGIPLKIAFPQLDITLFDSLNKRIKFLQNVIDELGLDNGEGKCEAIHGRAEEAGKNTLYREKYDFVVSRAVANMAVLSEYCLPFTKVGGLFIPYKSGEIDEELSNSKKAINILGGKYVETKKLVLPDSDIKRSFVIVKKIKNTPKAYPRKAGTASKQPL